MPGPYAADRPVCNQSADAVQPVTCRDFMQYLVYIERNAENLQFYLWYRDYAQRFSALALTEQVLSPEYTPPQMLVHPSPALTRPVRVSRATEKFVNKAFSNEEAAHVKETQLEAPNWEEPRSPFSTPPITPRADSTHVAPFSASSIMDPDTLMGVDHKQASADAFEKVNIMWQPCMYMLCFDVE